MDGWRKFTYDDGSEFCYKQIQNKWNYDKHRQNCQSLGGDLASIHSQEEMTFINDNVLYGNAPLIGAKRVGDSSAFSWADGTPWDWQLWWAKDHYGDCVKLQGLGMFNWECG